MLAKDHAVENRRAIMGIKDAEADQAKAYAAKALAYLHSPQGRQELQESQQRAKEQADKIRKMLCVSYEEMHRPFTI